MSEHKPGEFIRSHAKRELAGAAGAVAISAGLGLAAYARRKRRHHELHTFSGKNLPADIFAFQDETNLELNVPTKIAGSLYTATVNGDNDGLTFKALEEHFKEVDKGAFKQCLESLEEVGFIERGKLSDGSTGYKVTPELIEVILDGTSEPLAQYFYAGPEA